MATSDDLLKILPNFWDSLDQAEREAVKALLFGYSQAVNDMYVRLYQVDLAKSIKTITPTVRREWWYIDLDAKYALPGVCRFQLDIELAGLPSIQEGVTKPGLVLDLTTDYTFDPVKHIITFTSVQGKQAAARVLPTQDSLGKPNAAGNAIAAGILTGLVLGADYDFVSPTQVRLYSQAAFLKFAALKDPEINERLAKKAFHAPSVETDEQLVYRNFGYPLGLAPQDVPVSLAAYARVVKGLWYIAWNGPTPRNLRNGISLIFGFPVSPIDGAVTEINTSGTLPIVVVSPDRGTTQYPVTIPLPFLPIVSVGQQVREFDALTDAVEILDETSHPSWWVEDLGLSRYVAKGVDLSKIPDARKAFLKSLLRFTVFAVKLKDFGTFTDIITRSQELHAAGKIITQLKPIYSQFAFLGDIVWTETGPDLSTAVDVQLLNEVQRLMHQTTSDNAVNELFNTSPIVTPTRLLPGYDDATFADFDAYYAAASGGLPDHVAFNLDDDHPVVWDTLLMEATAPDMTGYPTYLNTDGTDPNFEAWCAVGNRRRDVTAPTITLTPAPGNYTYPALVSVTYDEPCTIYWTRDGSTPSFGPPVVGYTLTGPITLLDGTNTIKIIAKDRAGNIQPVATYVYNVYPRLAPLQLNPDPAVIQASPVPLAVRFFCEDPTVNIYYTLDGTAPSDFVFKDLSRLNGHRIVWAGDSSIRLENPTKAVLFPYSTATVNLDQGKVYNIKARPSTRYYAYFTKEGDAQYRLSFTPNNTAFQTNSPTRLLVGFAVTDENGAFPRTGIVNALDAGSVHVVTRDAGLGTIRAVGAVIQINQNAPVPVSSSKSSASLRYFGKTASGQFTPPRVAVYSFDTVAPSTRLISSTTNIPYFQTLKVELAGNEGSVIYWTAQPNVVPEPVLFGLHYYLNDPVVGSTLSVLPAGVNAIVPSNVTFTLRFRRQAFDGTYTDLTTTGDLRGGGALVIPTVANAFFDISVTYEFADATKWKLEVGQANVPAVESRERYLVARVRTDSSGIFDPPANKGSILNAAGGFNTALSKKTYKYTDPILLDIGLSPYTYVVSYFAQDLAGNCEAMQSRTFSG